MSDDYEHKTFWEESPSQCIEQNEKGECLMSMKIVMMDLSKPFCQTVKDSSNDKTAQD